MAAAAAAAAKPVFAAARGAAVLQLRELARLHPTHYRGDAGLQHLLQRSAWLLSADLPSRFRRVHHRLASLPPAVVGLASAQRTLDTCATAEGHLMRAGAPGGEEGARWVEETARIMHILACAFQCPVGLWVQSHALCGGVCEGGC